MCLKDVGLYFTSIPLNVERSSCLKMCNFFLKWELAVCMVCLDTAMSSFYHLLVWRHTNQPLLQSTFGWVTGSETAWEPYIDRAGLGVYETWSKEFAGSSSLSLERWGAPGALWPWMCWSSKGVLNNTNQLVDLYTTWAVQPAMRSEFQNAVASSFVTQLRLGGTGTNVTTLLAWPRVGPVGSPDGVPWEKKSRI